MDKNDIILKAISLLEAIKKDDIEEAKNLVTYLNNNFEPTEELYYLNGLIPLHSVVIHYRNNTFLYVLDNLQHTGNNNEQLKWNVHTTNLLKRANYQEMENFILDFIKNNTTIENYQMPNLIQICVTIDNYDLLNEIRSIFNDKLNQEV